jgi:hypothetical protein
LIESVLPARSLHLSPCGRGRIASLDAIRVRGCGLTILYHSPQPSGDYPRLDLWIKPIPIFLFGAIVIGAIVPSPAYSGCRRPGIGGIDCLARYRIQNQFLRELGNSNTFRLDTISVVNIAEKIQVFSRDELLEASSVKSAICRMGRKDRHLLPGCDNVRNHFIWAWSQQIKRLIFRGIAPDTIGNNCQSFGRNVSVIPKPKTIIVSADALCVGHRMKINYGAICCGCDFVLASCNVGLGLHDAGLLKVNSNLKNSNDRENNQRAHLDPMWLGFGLPSCPWVACRFHRFVGLVDLP